MSCGFLSLNGVEFSLLLNLGINRGSLIIFDAEDVEGNSHLKTSCFLSVLLDQSFHLMYLFVRDICEILVFGRMGDSYGDLLVPSMLE